MIGTVDLGNIDMGGLDTFGDRMALARVVGGRAVKLGGRWTLQGGTRDGVQLDHPTVLRVLGEPLEAEAGTVRYEPRAELDAAVALVADEPESEAAPASWTPGPLLLAYLERLVCPLKLDYAAALIDERMTGRSALVPDGLRAELAEKVASKVASLARRDAST